MTWFRLSLSYGIRADAPVTHHVMPFRTYEDAARYLSEFLARSRADGRVVTAYAIDALPEPMPQ